jgi:outer membrane protein assembly factor BamB/tetratricopeptide (TPR) repeat protein
MDRYGITRVGWVALLCLGMGGSPARTADEEEESPTTVLPGESLAVGRRLAAADKLVAQKKWTVALDEYQRILEEAGDVLVPEDGKRRRHCVQARRLCQLRMAALFRDAVVGPGLLRGYRDRVDPAAQKWLRQGTEERNLRLLRRVVDDSFCSRSAEAALEVLGDLTFERGDFEEAGHWWRLLAVPASEEKQRGSSDKPKAKPQKPVVKPLDPRSSILVFPDPQPERVARVRAKQIIARLFLGDREGVALEMKAFRAVHSRAAGELAGSRGNYADILDGVIKKAQDGSPDEDDFEITFGGRPSRNLVYPKALDPRIGALGYQWSTRLDTGEVDTTGPQGNGTEDRGGSRSLAFYPVIAGNLVLWADARYVNAHELLTGRLVFRFDLLAEADRVASDLQHVDLHLPARRDLRYTLSVDGDRAYVRLGTQDLGPKTTRGVNRRRFEFADQSKTFLLCLNLKPDAKQRLEWLVGLQALPKDVPQRFEGAPVVRDGRVYIAVSHCEGTQTLSAIACYDADKGRQLWRQDVCETQTGQVDSLAERRFMHHLVTLAGPQVVYCSHSGAIVALDARTGKRAWAVRYASRGPTREDGEPSPRDLAPCVYAAGRVYVAPRDCDRLFCLDADTGHEIWSRDSIEIVHLLGVTRGRLIVTTPQGIRAMNAVTGADNIGKTGWVQPADGKLRSFGRGLLAGGWVFWPTEDTAFPLRALKIEDGEQDADAFDPHQFHRIKHGNLVYGNGCLVVASTQRLYVYVPEERYLTQREKEAAQARAPASAFYRLALAEMGARRYPQALEHFARAEWAGPEEEWQGQPVRVLARRGRYDLLLQRAGSDQADRHWDRAAAWLLQASGEEFPVAARLSALSRLAHLWTAARQPGRAVAVWQSVLEDRRLRRGHVSSPTGTSEQAARWAAAQIKDLMRIHGQDVYAAVEKKAAGQLASAQGEYEVAVLEKLAREYPNAAVTGPALLRLARGYAKADRPALAARAYRRLLGQANRSALTDEDLAMACTGLARAYEAQHLWKAARTAWERLADQYGAKTFAAVDGRRKVADFVALQLQNPSYRQRPSAARPELDLPLVRVWPRSDSSDPDEVLPTGQLLMPQGRSGNAAGQDVVLLVRGQEPDLALDCRSLASGTRRWQVQLRDRAEWAGLQGHAVLVAGAGGVLCLSLADGQPLWEFTPPDSPLITVPLLSDNRLSAFRLTSTCLYFLQGQRRLFALDANSGRLLWSLWAPAAQVRPVYPGGRFNPLYHAGDDWLVLQTGGGKRLVLESRTGRLVRECPALESPWLQAPLALEERRLCLASGDRQVVLFDPATGKNLWTYSAALAPDSSLAGGGAARVFGNREALFALVPLNIGYQLERLDPLTGTPLWSGGLRVLRDALEPDQFGIGPGTLVYVQRRILHARSLATGKLLWSQALRGPAGAWRALCVGETVLAYPVRAQPRLRWSELPPVGMVPSLLVESRAAEGFSVYCLDAKDGELVQRLNFAGSSSAGVVAVLPHGLAVGVGDQAWVFSDSAKRAGSR